MSYSSQACRSLNDAKKVCEDHPWNIVLLLVQAAVFALLAVSVAIEATNQGEV